MRADSRERRPSPAPAAVDIHAAEHLRFIRDTMASATAFTAVSGRGSVAMGVTACIAAAIAERQRSEEAWLLVWLVEAALAFTIGAIATGRKARAARAEPRSGGLFAGARSAGSPVAGSPVAGSLFSGLLFTGAGRRFMVSYAAPMVAGAIQTVAMYLAGLGGFLPGMWLLLYGTAAVAGGVSSIKPIPIAGACYMALGAVAWCSPTSWGNWFMAAGFGVVHIGFGLLIARRYGG